MIEQIYNFFSLEMLYFWINLGVLPFWFLIIFFPQSRLCKYIATSIFPFFLLTIAYIFVLYKSYLNSYDFLGNFNLYLGIDRVSDLLNNEGGEVVSDSPRATTRFSEAQTVVELNLPRSTRFLGQA